MEVIHNWGKGKPFMHSTNQKVVFPFLPIMHQWELPVILPTMQQVTSQLCIVGRWNTLRMDGWLGFWVQHSARIPPQSLPSAFSWEETVSHIDLSDFSLCTVGYSQFRLKVADEESKCIPHEFPRFCAKNVTVWCVNDYCLQRCNRPKRWGFWWKAISEQW